MNNLRRKRIEELSAQIEALKDLLEEIKDEEEEYRDNMPENLQNSERYEISDNACDILLFPGTIQIFNCFFKRRESTIKVITSVV